MIERGMMRTYLHYVVPASIAFTLACVYSIIDGLFVGNHVGDAGLAGINIAWPLYAAVIATGTGIGMGGAVISAIRSGAGNEAGARRATGHTLMMLAVASLPIAFALIAFPSSSARFWVVVAKPSTRPSPTFPPWRLPRRCRSCSPAAFRSSVIVEA